MKDFNNIKMISSFREISNILDMITLSIRVVAFVLIILQTLLLIRDTKSVRIKNSR